MKGVFITFEGPDASGKTTQIRRLAEVLRERNEEPLVTREPGGTPVGEQIRGILLDRGNAEMDPVTEAFLYAASRAQHVQQVIRSALAEGRIVISDRFTDSSIAYQGYGRQLGEMVANINEKATGGLEPDLTFLLMTPEGTMRKRRPEAEEDRIEAERGGFHARVLAGFEELASRNPERIVRIDGRRAIDDIAAEIRERTFSLIDRSRKYEK